MPCAPTTWMCRRKSPLWSWSLCLFIRLLLAKYVEVDPKQDCERLHCHWQPPSAVVKPGFGVIMCFRITGVQKPHGWACAACLRVSREVWDRECLVLGYVMEHWGHFCVLKSRTWQTWQTWLLNLWGPGGAAPGSHREKDMWQESSG